MRSRCRVLGVDEDRDIRSGLRILRVDEDRYMWPMLAHIR